MDNVEFCNKGDLDDMDSFGEQMDSSIDAFNSAISDGGAEHSVSFGAKLDCDKYNELAQRRDAADAIMKGTHDDVEFLNAFQQREAARTEMNDMLANSDEFKNWSETVDSRIDACLEPLRRNGINISFRGALDDQSISEDGIEAQADDCPIREAANEIQNDVVFTEADIPQDMGQPAEGLDGDNVDGSDSVGLFSEHSDDSDTGEAAADGPESHKVSFKGSTSQYYCPVCGHTWWSPYWPNYCPKSGCLGQPKKM